MTSSRSSHFDETDEPETGAATPGAHSLIAAVRDADAILFVTPEYIGSIPGVLKSAVDSASKLHPATSPLANKPVGGIGASTGMFGAVWAQAELRKALGLAGGRVLDQELAVPTAHEAFKENGRLVRVATRAGAYSATRSPKSKRTRPTRHRVGRTLSLVHH